MTQTLTEKLGEEFFEDKEFVCEESVDVVQNGLEKFLKFLIKKRSPSPSDKCPPPPSPPPPRPEPDTLITDKEKYTFEDHHEITTKDGYILKLHRIKKRYSNPDHAEFKDVVFLQHGLVDSSASWFIDENGLAFTLADAGYDVWLGNIRGNVYSYKHVKDNKNYGQYKDTEDYWKFTWDDIASKDLPALIEYVLERTRKQNLYYVGHSQGGLIGFVELSRNPKLASQIKHFFALAPAVYLGNMTSIGRLLIDAKYYFLRIFYLLITLSFLPWELPNQILTSIFPYPTHKMSKKVINCEHEKSTYSKIKTSIEKKIRRMYVFSFIYHLFMIVCGIALTISTYAKNVYERIVLHFMMTFWEALLGRKGVNENIYTFLSAFPALETVVNAANKREMMKLTCGESDQSLTEEKLKHCLKFYPSDSSIRNLFHFMQLVRSGRPATFNYGLSVTNQVKYLQCDPIPFNVRNIDPEKCTIFFGENDSLVPAEDIATNLRQCTNDLNLIYGFNHVDFVWAPAAKEKVYKKILRKIKDFEEDEAVNRNI